MDANREVRLRRCGVRGTAFMITFVMMALVVMGPFAALTINGQQKGTKRGKYPAPAGVSCNLYNISSY